jgi:hypothetical protein
VDIPRPPQEEVRGYAEWQALHAALQEGVPACFGRDSFTADRLRDDERAKCEAICAACPVAEQCDAYATAAKVTAGYWAGNFYTPRGRA